MSDIEKLTDLLIEKKDLRFTSYGQEAAWLFSRGVTVQKWIPVSERLPEDPEAVLCWYEYFRFGDYNEMYQAYGIGYCFDGIWGGEVTNGHKCKVLAWMPLPEPPKECE